MHTSTLTEAHALYRVGDLRVDTGLANVMRGDIDVPLPRLSFDLLIVLTREAPNLVSLDALMQQVWPAAVVNQETVIQRIKLLRAALGDDPHAPRYIANVRGRGYRLIAQVERCERATTPGSPTRSSTAFGAANCTVNEAISDDQDRRGTAVLAATNDEPGHRSGVPDHATSDRGVHELIVRHESESRSTAESSRDCDSRSIARPTPAAINPRSFAVKSWPITLALVMTIGAPIAAWEHARLQVATMKPHDSCIEHVDVQLSTRS